MVTRDSMVWWAGIVGAVITGLAMNIGLFPWIPEQVQHAISIAAFIVGIISGKMATSPLKGKDDPPAGSARPRIPPAAMILLAVALGAGAPMMLTGCVGNKAPILTPTQAEKALDAVKRTGDIIAAVQASEIAFYQAGDVPPATHQQIQAALAKASATVLTALDALNTAGTGNPHDLVAAVRDAVKSLSATFAHLSAQSAAKLSAVLDTAAALVDLALAS